MQPFGLFQILQSFLSSNPSFSQNTPPANDQADLEKSFSSTEKTPDDSAQSNAHDYAQSNPTQGDAQNATHNPTPGEEGKEKEAYEAYLAFVDAHNERSKRLKRR